MAVSENLLAKWPVILEQIKNSLEQRQLLLAQFFKVEPVNCRGAHFLNQEWLALVKSVVGDVRGTYTMLIQGVLLRLESEWLLTSYRAGNTDQLVLQSKKTSVPTDSHKMQTASDIMQSNFQNDERQR